VGFVLLGELCVGLEGLAATNAVFFRIEAMAYNICRIFVLKTLAVGWHKHQVQPLRWQLFQTAGKVVEHVPIKCI